MDKQRPLFHDPHFQPSAPSHRYVRRRMCRVFITAVAEMSLMRDLVSAHQFSFTTFRGCTRDPSTLHAEDCSSVILFDGKICLTNNRAAVRLAELCSNYLVSLRLAPSFSITATAVTTDRTISCRVNVSQWAAIRT